METRRREDEPQFESNFTGEGLSVISERSIEKGLPNQDAILCNQEEGLFAVFDGVGGLPHGDIAANTAKDYIEKNLPAILDSDDITSIADIKKALHELFKGANQELFEKAKELGVKKIGTTASVVTMWEKEDGTFKLAVANSGDSRVYVFRANGKLVQATLDDNTIRDEIDSEKHSEEEIEEFRRIEKKLNNVTDESELSSTEWEFFKNRNKVSSHLGQSPKGANMTLFLCDLEPNDIVIATTDGIHDNLTDDEIEEIVYNNENAVQDLITAAQERSRDKQHLRHKQDDMSAVMIKENKHILPVDLTSPLPSTETIAPPKAKVEEGASQHKELEAEILQKLETVNDNRTRLNRAFDEKMKMREKFQEVDDVKGIRKIDQEINEILEELKVVMKSRNNLLGEYESYTGK